MSAQNTLANKAKRRVERTLPPSYGPVSRKHPAVKSMLKLSRLPLEKLHRRLAQSARRAATCRYLIASLSPNSMFAVKIKAAQTYELSYLRQVRAEITSRHNRASNPIK